MLCTICNRKTSIEKAYYHKENFNQVCLRCYNEKVKQADHIPFNELPESLQYFSRKVVSVRLSFEDLAYLLKLAETDNFNKISDVINHVVQERKEEKPLRNVDISDTFSHYRAKQDPVNSPYVTKRDDQDKPKPKRRKPAEIEEPDFPREKIDNKGGIEI